MSCVRAAWKKTNTEIRSALIDNKTAPTSALRTQLLMDRPADRSLMKLLETSHCSLCCLHEASEKWRHLETGDGCSEAYTSIADVSGNARRIRAHRQASNSNILHTGR